MTSHHITLHHITSHYITFLVLGFCFRNTRNIQHTHYIELHSYRIRLQTAVPGRNRFGWIRFGSGLFFDNSSFRFGSVRTNICPGSTRFDLRFSDASWLGPVRFGSVPRPVPAGSRIKRFGSVPFGRFG